MEGGPPGHRAAGRAGRWAGRHRDAGKITGAKGVTWVDDGLMQRPAHAAGPRPGRSRAECPGFDCPGLGWPDAGRSRAKRTGIGLPSGRRGRRAPAHGRVARVRAGPVQRHVAERPSRAVHARDRARRAGARRWSLPWRRRRVRGGVPLARLDAAARSTVPGTGDGITAARPGVAWCGHPTMSRSVAGGRHPGRWSGKPTRRGEEDVRRVRSGHRARWRGDRTAARRRRRRRPGTGRAGAPDVRRVPDGWPARGCWNARPMGQRSRLPGRRAAPGRPAGLPTDHRAGRCLPEVGRCLRRGGPLGDPGGPDPHRSACRQRAGYHDHAAADRRRHGLAVRPRRPGGRRRRARGGRRR